MKKVFCTIYKSFSAGFSVKVTTNDTITNARGTTFDAVKVVGDNFIINNTVYLSFENDQDFKLSASFTPITLYKVRNTFRHIVENIPNMFTGEGATLAMTPEWDKKVITIDGAGGKKLALSPAIFQSTEAGGEIMKGVAISLNGSDWSYMKIAEVRGIYDVLEHVDLVAYQIIFATAMKSCMDGTSSPAAIAAGMTPPAPANRSNTVYNTAAQTPPSVPPVVETPKIVVTQKAPYQAPAQATPANVTPAVQKQTPVVSADDIDGLFGTSS